jgi:AmmeMemoRadiSam system protein A
MMVDKILLRIAKTAILAKFDNSYEIDKEKLYEDYPFLKEQRATFVTLNENSALRGCIGSIIAHRTFLEDIISNARSAAFEDPRFSPLSEGELEQDLTLEVSVLSKPVILEYEDYEDLKSKIVAFKDGLILKYGAYQGTFLPQVWDELPQITQFLEHLSYKAGANPSIYNYHPDIYKYNVEHIKDKWDAILPL